jgi:hypothetical protein
MLRLFVLVTMSLLMLATPGIATPAVPGSIDVTVRVYDSAAVSDRRWRHALAEAAAAFSSALVNVHWSSCGHAKHSDATSCATPLGPGEFVIRIVPGKASPGQSGMLVLGDVKLLARTREAALATIYVEPVRWLAGLAGADVGTLLGRAIAHELGHLFLATKAHAAHGLMCALWSPDEIRLNRPADWTFAQADAEAIRARAAAGVIAATAHAETATTGSRPTACADSLNNVSRPNRPL